MVYEGVVEAVLHGGSKVLAVLLVQGQDGHDLVQQHLVHEAANGIVVHAVAHDVEAAQVCAQNKAGMSAVEDANLALLIGGHVGGNEYIALDAGLAEGQHIVELLVAFDDPNTEYFANVQQGIGVAVLSFQLGNFLGITDAAGNDAVYQAAAEGALLVDISAELCAQAPLLNVLVDALLQFLAVVVDQLAGEHDHAGLAGLEALVQHLGQLAGEGGAGNIAQLAGRIVNDAGFGGVGDDVLQIIGNGNFHHSFEALSLVGVQAAGDRGDDPLVVYLLAVLAAAQVQGVQAFLLVDHLSKAGSDGLNQNALAVPAGLLVGQVKPVVYECAQEIAFAELHNLFGGIFQDVAGVTGLLKDFIIELFHVE